MADLKYYDVILKPVLTEKSMGSMDVKKYAFLVHPDATKAQVKEIAEKKMELLNAINIEGAMKQVAGTARSMGVTVED